MAASNIASTGIVLEVLTKDNYLDWSVLVKNYLIGKELWYNIVEGWTSLHVAVDAVQQEIMEKLVEMGASLTEKDSKGYTPFALAAESPGHIYVRFVRWMLNKGGGGKELLTMKINSDDDKDVAATLLQQDDGTQIPLSYEFDQCMRPIHALAHIPTAFVRGTRLGFFERKIYTASP
ncbi:hypothetical protein TSUD_276430 [Trifolium subterraneum]|uniref:Uncharacterized protein n=1 Tax=Trifolium subterraneum TaxID=3900 RepID=A0A2Z6NC01_TRISU|nr:hypothetical protein TSUD_276430 [Trifolium subterraneum]